MSIISKKLPYLSSLKFLEKGYLTSHHHTGEGTTGSKGLQKNMHSNSLLVVITFIIGRIVASD